MSKSMSPFATFLIIGPTCFFLGLLFASFPYDYNVIWSSPALGPNAAAGSDPREPFYLLLETHLKFLHSSPPVISRILHIVIGTGLLGFLMKLYKASEANILFDGASLALYTCAIIVYITNIVKGLRIVSAGTYGQVEAVDGEELDAGATAAADRGQYIGREDSLKVFAASNTILALVLVGVLVLQAGQWYAQKKEAAEIAEMDRVRDEKKRDKAQAHTGKGDKKKQ